MEVLVLGASGGIGSNVVKQLVEDGRRKVKVVCRSEESFLRLKEKVGVDELGNVTKVIGNVQDMDETEVLELIEGVDAVISGLGSNLTFRGVFLPPFDIVTNQVMKICEGAKKSGQKIKFICTGTVGVTQLDSVEDDSKRSFSQYLVLGLLWSFLPPYRDSYNCARYFEKVVGKSEQISWCWVRPDALTDEKLVTEYQVYPSLQFGLFSPQTTSRENVAAFMCELVHDGNKMQRWNTKFPVILNKPVAKI